MLLNLIGAAVSLPGVISSATKRLFGILGLALNALTLFIGICFLILSIIFA